MAKNNDLVISIVNACGGYGAIAEAVSVAEGKRKEQGFVRAWPRVGAIPVRYNPVLRKLGGDEVRLLLIELSHLS